MSMPTPPQPVELSPDERLASVLAYTPMFLIRGEAVIKGSVRSNIWLRTAAVPEYIHLKNANIVTFGGVSLQTLAFKDYFLPTAQVVAFHPVPPNDEPLDYEETEKNRKMEAITALVGTFRFNGQIRISTQTSLNTSLETMKIAFLSLYNVEISNPSLPGMGVLQARLVLVRPSFVHFGVK